MSTAWYQQDAPAGVRQYAASKVPVVTAYFWIIKVLTTGMGETTSDFLVHRYNPYLAVFAGAIAFAAAMAAQLLTRRYVTWTYWLAVVMVSVFGTMAADVTHIVFGVPYAASTAAFIVILAVILTLWQKSEGTLSIHSIVTPRRELFYWATVLATFALGTAAGDMTARTLHLGFLASGIMFAVVFAIPGVAYWKLGMNPIGAFWFAYIVTRPFGASFADWTAIGHAFGGLGLGYGSVSAVLTVLIVILVAVMAVTGKDVEERRLARAAARQGRGGRHRSMAGSARPARAWATAPAPQPPGYDDEGGHDYGYGGGYRPASQPDRWSPGPVPGAWPASGTGRPADPTRRYGPADQTRRLARPGAPAGPPGPAGPHRTGAPLTPPGEPWRYGHGDQARRLDRRDPRSHGPGSPEAATGGRRPWPGRTPPGRSSRYPQDGRPGGAVEPPAGSRNGYANGHVSNGRPSSNGHSASPGHAGHDRDGGGGAARPDLWPPFLPDERPPGGQSRPDDDQAGW